MTLDEFNERADGLERRPVTETLAMDVVAVEPLAGRNTLDYDRDCIVEDDDGNRFVAAYD